MQGEGGAPSSSVTVDILQAGICLNPPQNTGMTLSYPYCLRGPPSASPGQ